MTSPTQKWIPRLAVTAALALVMFDVACDTARVQEAADTGGGPATAACMADAKEAPLDFTMEQLTGGDVTLASFKGKVILVNFWATWCAPCKAEIPGFVELQDEYPDDLQVLGISIDDTFDDMRPFAAEYKINYPLLLGKGRQDVEDAYGPLFGIPQSFLISRDGLLCKKHAGIAPKEQFEREIKALL